MAKAWLHDFRFLASDLKYCWDSVPSEQGAPKLECDQHGSAGLLVYCFWTTGEYKNADA